MQSTIDSLVSLKGRRELREIILAPVPSPKITAERMVFISRLGRQVGDRPAIEIQNELIRSNPNMNNIQVHKIKHYFHIIKVVCEDTETADAAISDGLYAFHTKIVASQWKKEQFTELITCFRCYKFEDHYSNECTTSQTISSEYARVGHTHRDCHAVEKQCINCPPGQNFRRTLAPFCTVRKDAIAQKQQKLKNGSKIQNNKTYANIVKTTIKETTPPPGQACHKGGQACPTHHPKKKKRRPPPIIYRSRGLDDFEAIPNVLSSEWIENESKKREIRT